MSYPPTVVSPALFQPSGDHRPHWPSLKLLEVLFEMFDTEGIWLYEIHARSSRFSLGGNPINRQLNPIFLAATRASSEMPRLEYMEIESYRSGDPDRQSNYMLFVAQGATEKGNVLSACTNKPRKQSIVYWDSDTEFDPSEINDLWRSLRPLDPKIVGREELGKIYEHQDFDSL